MNEMFDEKGFAKKTCRVKVYDYDFENKEYIGSSMEHVVEGSGIPANTTLIHPNEDKVGYTQVFDEKLQQWKYVEDHRYDDVYNIHSKIKEEIRYLGPLKEEHTLLEPPSDDHEFINGDWVISEEVEKRLINSDLLMNIQKNKERLDDVEKTINILERIKDRTEEEELELQRLMDESISLFREIKKLESELK